MPETNSLEVHVSRLRAKLAVSHLEELVETDPRGGYRLAAGACHEDGFRGRAGDPAVDRTAGLGEVGARITRGGLAYAME